jgi:hypothetical protein
VLGNPRLALTQAVHITAGAQVRAAEALSVEVAGYFRRLDSLVSRSTDPSPPVGMALVQEGVGASYGGQLLVRLRGWRGLSGWVSYTIGRSERQDHPTGATRLFDYDQTHVLAAVASYGWKRWTFGARFRYATGMPRTPVVGAYYDARHDRYDPLFGPQNSSRLPDFYQLDLRVDRRFELGRATLDLSLDVENVTYHQNAEEIVYSEDYSRRGYITGLPTLAILGARVGF